MAERFVDVLKVRNIVLLYALRKITVQIVIARFFTAMHRIIVYQLFTTAIHYFLKH